MSELRFDSDLLPEQIRAACILEAAARKAGNVHPAARFPDLCFADFVASADLAAPWIAQAASLGVGEAVRRAVEATVRGVGTNTNLGIVLLLTPLAAIPEKIPAAEGVGPVLDSLTLEDSRQIYEAIRAAEPGGMGEVEEQDVATAPTRPIVEIMSLAADRDLVARQYARGFEDVLCFKETFLRYAESLPGWEEPIIATHLALMAERPDSLIARKCGRPTAVEAAKRARQVLQSGWPATVRSREQFRALDDWLRSDGHRRNPGTTADLIAAVLFVALRNRHWSPPQGATAV